MIDQQEFQFSRACDYKDADNVDENCSGKVRTRLGIEEPEQVET